MSNFSPSDLSVIKEGVSFATERGRNSTAVPTFRQGSVQIVNLGERSAMVQMDTDPNPTMEGGDDSLGGPIQASLWYAGGVRAGDRVQVMFYPPHGAAIVAVIAGGWENWHYVGGDGEVPFASGWQNFPTVGPPYQSAHSAASYRRIGRWCELRGRVERASGVGTVVFILPDDYRPINRVATVVLAGESALGTGVIVVDPVGTVEWISLGTPVDAADGSLFLDGVVYSLDVFPV